MPVVFERVFLLSGVFHLTLLPAVFKVSLGASSSTSKLVGLHADLQNIAPARQKKYGGRSYLRVMAGRLIMNLPLTGFKLFLR